MDDRSFRLGNRVGRQPRRGRGARVRRCTGRRCGSTGRPRSAWPAPTWARRSTACRSSAGRPVAVAAGQMLASARSTARGPRATCCVGRRGRRARAPRQPGHLHARWVRRSRRPGPADRATCCASARPRPAGRRRRPSRRRSGRRSTRHWDVGVLDGPHAAPEFLTPPRARGVLRRHVEGPLQLRPHRRAPRRARSPTGPALTAARRACTPRTSTTPPTRVGAVDLTGDMPVILGPDGPSLGGFVCPLTVAADRALEARPAAAGRHGPLPRAHGGRSPERRPRYTGGSAVLPAVLHRVAGDGRPAGRRPTAGPATTTCSSSTATRCSTSTCACGSTC